MWVLDQDRVMCAALVRLLEAMAIHAVLVEDGKALLDRLEGERPNCLVVGFGPGECLGLELLERGRCRGESLAVVMVSLAADVASTVRAMKHGAVDVVERPVDPDALLAAVVRGLALDAEWREARSRAAEVAQRLEALTPREREVFELLAAGKPNKWIAAELGTSEKTVKVHRGRVMQKLQARSVVDLVRLLDRGSPLADWSAPPPHARRAAAPVAGAASGAGPAAGR